MTATTDRQDLIGLLPTEARTALADHFRERGVASYRVGQTLDRLYGKVALSFDEITELSRAERASTMASDSESPGVRALSSSRRQ